MTSLAIELLIQVSFSQAFSHIFLANRTPGQNTHSPQNEASTCVSQLGRKKDSILESCSISGQPQNLTQGLHCLCLSLTALSILVRIMQKAEEALDSLLRLVPDIVSLHSAGILDRLWKGLQRKAQFLPRVQANNIWKAVMTKKETEPRVRRTGWIWTPNWSK